MLGQRRRYERVAFFYPLQLTLLSKGITGHGRSTDISVQGIGITTELVLERGQEVRIRFQFETEPQSSFNEEVFGQVVYNSADEDGNRIGIEFYEPINHEKQPVLSEKLHHL